ncbi:MAG: N-acetylneuraminate synthase family protein, partial [Phycisphaerales bacterium]|nr:N-acetylneuraminate synthase family protein [Phycisphaerales bacterium]
MNPVRIGEQYVGPGYPAQLVAEIGINHNGDMALAREMIAAAAGAGATAVKFQNYRTEDFVRDHSLAHTYRSQGRDVTESQYHMFKRCELDVAQLAGLCEHCRARGVMFHSTPTSESGIRDLRELGVPVLKNGSDYLTHLPLIRAMGESGLPTVLSTGMASLAEIDDAVAAFRATGNAQIILLHCTSSYPTAPADTNLRRIPALARAFGCPTGFSDHT